MRLFASRAVTVAAAFISAIAPLAFAGGVLVQTAAAQTVGPNAGIEERVRVLFADAPDMIAVAKCESGFRQFASEGVVLRGGAGRGYLGIFQIGERLHTGTAAALGFDITTIDGNLGYARHMYDRQGSVPWIQCVPKGAVTYAPAPVAVPTAAAPTGVSPVTRVPLTQNMSTGSVGAEALLLQQILNGNGFTVATEGPGSPGNETTRFGALTREAVRRFQCAKNIACSGTEWTTGYGRVGPKTRAALNAL